LAGIMKKDERVHDERSSLHSLRQRCATSKRTIRMHELRRMINQELISAELAKHREGHTASSEPQQVSRIGSREIQFEPVTCTNSPVTSKSAEPLNQGRKPWLLGLPSLFRRSTWPRVSRTGVNATRVHPIDASEVLL